MAKRRGKRSRRPRRINHHRKIIEGADFINSMPNEILNHILSFIPIHLAITTSVLSKQWRHAWCELPCLHIRTTPEGIDQTLLSYRAPKIMILSLYVTQYYATEAQFGSWVEFAISRNVERLSLTGRSFNYKTYGFPDCFYLSSSLRQLTLANFYMLHGSSTVSWNLLRKLTLSSCNLYDEYIANILSGSPNLETLQLFGCGGFKRLDLSKSPSLRALEISWSQRLGQVEIVAPHILSLDLLKSDADTPCTLVDVSSLADATLGILLNRYYPFMSGFRQYADFLQTVVLKMLANLQNVERLTFREGYLLQILSLAMLSGVPLPTLKVQTLTVRANFVRSVIPSIARLLQSSPGLKKLVVHATNMSYIEDSDLDIYLSISQGLNSATCWRSKYEVFPTTSKMNSMSNCNDAMLKLLASFLKLVLRNAKRLEKIVVWLGDSYFNDEQMDEELFHMVGTLSPNNNVSIEIKIRKC